MKLIVVPISKFENTLPVIREQEALGLTYFRDERVTYMLASSNYRDRYPMWCYKLFFNDGSSELTFENRCPGELE